MNRVTVKVGRQTLVLVDRKGRLVQDAVLVAAGKNYELREAAKVGNRAQRRAERSHRQ